MTWILLFSAILMALVAGVFLSFSDFVMRGLAMAPGTAGAAGMVGLNRTVYRSVFMVLLMGNVPMNRRLDALADSPADVAAYWPRYLRGWTVLNHLRVAASATAAMSWGIAAGLA